MTSGVGIVAHDVGESRVSGGRGLGLRQRRGSGGCRGSNPEVDLLGALCSPSGVGGAEHGSARSRVVPEEPITERGHSERDGYLGVDLNQLHLHALLV